MVETQVISYGVVGHVSRETYARSLADRLGATLHVDDGSLGSNRNHDLVWREAARCATDWVCVVEDDAELPDDFERNAEAALRNAPDRGVIGLYVGGERPPQWQHRLRLATARADASGSGWLSCDMLLWGVAVALPVELVEPMLSHVRYSRMPYDYRLGRWAAHDNVSVHYTWPSLVEHRDLPTLINHADGAPRDRPRRALRVGAGGTGGVERI